MVFSSKIKIFTSAQILDLRETQNQSKIDDKCVK